MAINKVKIGGISFHADYWSKRSEKDFVDECIKNGTHPLNLSDDQKTDWLKKAHAAIKEKVNGPAPEKKEESAKTVSK